MSEQEVAFTPTDTSCSDAASSVACTDAIDTYMSVSNALEKITLCPTLGEVINGVMSCEEEEVSSSSGDDSDEDVPVPTRAWACELGSQLFTLGGMCGFATGCECDLEHEADTDEDTPPPYVLQVLAGDEVVREWPLSSASSSTHALPTAELMAYCTVAGFGDLKTQTTRVDATVRTAYEMRAYVPLADTVSPAAVGGAPAVGAPAVVSSPTSLAAATPAAATPTPPPPHTFRLVYVRPPPASPCPAPPAKRARWTSDDAPVSSPAPQPQQQPQQQQQLPALATIHKHISEFLVTDTSFRLVPYKLNVYSEGGFFKPHVDTPTLDAARMLGTVVITLPSHFMGGLLRVYAPSGGRAAGEHMEVKTFDWSGYGYDSAGAALHCAAFYGDCVHEVTPVRSGVRVTVTYLIVSTEEEGGCCGTPLVPTLAATPSNDSGLDGSGGGGGGGAQGPHATHAARVANVILTSPFPCVGLLLAHRYTFSAAEGAHLKATDRVLYDALRARGARVHIQPVVYEPFVQHPLDDRDDKGYATNYVYAFGPSELRALGRGREPSPSALFGCAPRIPFIRCSPSGGGDMSDLCDNTGNILNSTHVPSCEYTGNEARAGEDGALYFTMALIVDVRT